MPAMTKEDLRTVFKEGNSCLKKKKNLLLTKNNQTVLEGDGELGRNFKVHSKCSSGSCELLNSLEQLIGLSKMN